jgi:HK97 family phage major capsid protein
MPTIRDTTHASSVYGGFQAYWSPEAGTITESEPVFGSVQLEAYKLAMSTRINNELRQDAPAIDGFLNQKAPEAINYFEDDAFINGIGVGQPLGLLNVDAMVSVSKETGQAASTVVWENLVKMFSRLLPTSMANAVWVINHDVFPQLATMSLSVGTGGSAIWMANGVGGPPMTILGRPVVFTEKAQTLGTAGDIYLADFTQYLIGDRQTITAFASEHRYAETDQTLFRFTERVDGRPWIDSALTPRNGSNTLSPFINLAVRA